MNTYLEQKSVSVKKNNSVMQKSIIFKSRQLDPLGVKVFQHSLSATSKT